MYIFVVVILMFLFVLSPSLNDGRSHGPTNVALFNFQGDLSWN